MLFLYKKLTSRSALNTGQLNNLAMKDLPGGKTYSGSPAREIKEKNRRDATFAEVKILKNKIKKFELEYRNKK